LKAKDELIYKGILENEVLKLEIVQLKKNLEVYRGLDRVNIQPTPSPALNDSETNSVDGSIKEQNE
jgi:hypothetical protein